MLMSMFWFFVLAEKLYQSKHWGSKWQSEDGEDKKEATEWRKICRQNTFHLKFQIKKWLDKVLLPDIRYLRTVKK